jgi:hypothetical protein
MKVMSRLSLNRKWRFPTVCGVTPQDRINFIIAIIIIIIIIIVAGSCGRGNEPSRSMKYEELLE